MTQHIHRKNASIAPAVDEKPARLRKRERPSAAFLVQPQKAPTKSNAWTWDRGEKDTVDTRIAYMHRVVENTLQRRNQLTGHVAFRVTTSNGKASNRQRIVDAAVETTRTIAYGIQALDRLSGIIEALMA